MRSDERTLRTDPKREGIEEILRPQSLADGGKEDPSRSLEDLFLDIESTSRQLSRLYRELRECLARRNSEELISVDEAVALTGLNERQLKYKVSIGEVKEKRLSPRKRLLYKEDVMKLTMRA